MIEFTYTNFAPPAATDKKGRRIVTSNKIRLWWDGDVLKYDRRWINRDTGKVSDHAIEHQFRIADPLDVATNIHWGCCGWSASVLQLQPLRDVVEEFMSKQSTSSVSAEELT